MAVRTITGTYRNRIAPYNLAMDIILFSPRADQSKGLIAGPVNVEKYWYTNDSMSFSSVPQRAGPDNLETA